jgi:hypothetical protein
MFYLENLNINFKVLNILLKDLNYFIDRLKSRINSSKFIFKDLMFILKWMVNISHYRVIYALWFVGKIKLLISASLFLRYSGPS